MYILFKLEQKYDTYFKDFNIISMYFECFNNKNEIKIKTLFESTLLKKKRLLLLLLLIYCFYLKHT